MSFAACLQLSSEPRKFSQPECSTDLPLTCVCATLYRYNGALDCIRQTVSKEGVSALWKGLEPALWRQATYGSMRYGFYAPIKDLIQPGVSKKDMPLWVRSAMLRPFPHCHVPPVLYVLAGCLVLLLKEPVSIPFQAKIVAGGGSGALSSALANPTDLVKVRI